MGEVWWFRDGSCLCLLVKRCPFHLKNKFLFLSFLFCACGIVYSHGFFGREVTDVPSISHWHCWGVWKTMMLLRQLGQLQQDCSCMDDIFTPIAGNALWFMFQMHQDLVQGLWTSWTCFCQPWSKKWDHATILWVVGGLCSRGYCGVQGLRGGGCGGTLGGSSSFSVVVLSYLFVRNIISRCVISCSAASLPGQYRSPVCGPFWEWCCSAEEMVYQLAPILFVWCFVYPGA